MRYSFTVLFLLLLAVALNFGPVSSSRTVALIKSAVFYAAYPFDITFSFIGNEVKNTALFLVRAYRAQAKVEELKMKFERANVLISELNYLRGENETLKGALGFVSRSKYNLISANVIARDYKSWDSIIILDAGERKGIESGMTVISGGGLVGRIVETSPNSSKVLLIISPQSMVGVMLPKKNIFGLAYGNGKGKLNIQYIPETASLEANEYVVVSSASQTLIPGIFVGTISKVEKNVDNIFQKVEVKPGADFSKLGIVFICKSY